MTKNEAINLLVNATYSDEWQGNEDLTMALEMAIKALEPKPFEKFKSTEEHISFLAGDYKCWDNRLTHEEALELCHILEQMNDVKELKQHIYELSIALDMYSAGKDYVVLRRTHYNNLEWLHNHGMTKEYYDVLFKHTKDESEE